MDNLCPQCGAPVEAGSNKCQYCGTAIANSASAQNTQQQQQQQQPQAQQYFNNYQKQPQNPAINMAWPIKNKIVAGILALLLGGIGVHKFYLGQTGKGILMLLFCWTYIPGIWAFIEGIMILVSNDENFQLKYKCRLN